MLCLQCDSNPQWILAACANLNSVLVDHAHCEKKAAANALSMVQRYPMHQSLVQEMIIVLKEEWEHFEMVYAELNRRNIPLTRDLGDDYARQLSQHIRKQEPDRFLDMLLVDALIEARSCERFSILSKCQEIPAELRSFYHNLLASEAGHYRVFTDLAREFYPADQVKSRLHELSALEADIVRSLPNLPLMHG
jgi:tRNA-(ms[2]io[6]A)-hydroxylase